LVGVHEGKELLGKFRRRCPYDIKMGFEVIGWEVAEGIHLSGYGNIPGSCEKSKEFSGVINVLGISSLALLVTASKEGHSVCN
jgi:hypothetical protein